MNSCIFAPIDDLLSLCSRPQSFVLNRRVGHDRLFGLALDLEVHLGSQVGAGRLGRLRAPPCGLEVSLVLLLRWGDISVTMLVV